MPDYIVDSSVVAGRYIQEPFTQHVKVLFRQMETGTRLIIPEFCLIECTNVLWKHVRNFGLPEPQAARMVQHLRQTPFTRKAVRALTPAALQLGLRHHLAIYDSIYLAMSDELGLALITVDQKQARAAAAEGVTLKPITDFTEPLP